MIMTTAGGIVSIHCIGVKLQTGANDELQSNSDFNNEVWCFWVGTSWRRFGCRYRFASLWCIGCNVESFQSRLILITALCVNWSSFERRLIACASSNSYRCSRIKFDKNSYKLETQNQRVTRHKTKEETRNFMFKSNRSLSVQIAAGRFGYNKKNYLRNEIEITSTWMYTHDTAIPPLESQPPKTDFTYCFGSLH